MVHTIYIPLVDYTYVCVSVGAFPMLNDDANQRWAALDLMNPA